MSEFPEGADAPPALSRRELLMLLGANAALAGATGCSRGTADGIAPYVRQPPEVTPGVPSRYATTMSLGGYGIGLLVESHEGRPTKAEGNPLHPASLGALGSFEQASVLSMYDPARVRSLTRYGVPSTWAALLEEVGAAPPAGKRIHFLLEPTSSPHLAPLIERLRRKGMVVHYDAPLSRENAWAGARLAFGEVLEARWDSRGPTWCSRSTRTSSPLRDRRWPGRARGPTSAGWSAPGTRSAGSMPSSPG